MCERELETDQRLQYIDLPSPSGHSHVSFSFSWTTQPEAWGPSPLGAVLSNSSDLQLTQTSYTELYYCFTPTRSILMASQARICHFRCLWTGMFDHHQAKITVMQFRGHPLPVHQFLSVLWDFNPVPYYQPSSPTQSQVRVGGQYTTFGTFL